MLQRRSHTPSLEEALQVVLGRGRLSSAGAVTSSPLHPQSAANNVTVNSGFSYPHFTAKSGVHTQVTWSPAYMLPGSQNPLRQTSKPNSASTQLPENGADSEAALRDRSLGLFTDSRGLFHQTLTNHQTSMSSQHQTALHQIGTAFENILNDTATTHIEIAGSSSAGGGEGGTAGVVEKSEAEKPDVVSSSGNVVPNVVAGENVQENSLEQNLLAAGLISPDSIMSCDSISTCNADLRGGSNPDLNRANFNVAPGVETLVSTGYNCGAVTTVSSYKPHEQELTAGLDVERLDRDKGTIDVDNGTIVSLESQVPESLCPVPEVRHNGSATVTVSHSQNEGSRIPANVSEFQSGTSNVFGVVSTGGTVVSGNLPYSGSGVDTGSGLSSFFLHRNVTSPIVAVVQPSIHSTQPQATQYSNNHGGPTAAVSTSGAVMVSDLSLGQSKGSGILTDVRSNLLQSCDAATTIYGRPRDSSQQVRSIWSCAGDQVDPVGTVGGNHSSVVSYVSASGHAHCPPNTMSILPPEKDDVLPASKLQPETYRKPSCSSPWTTHSGTIFAIPPSYAAQSQVAEFPGDAVLGFHSNHQTALGFSTAACIKDNITYEEIPVDDTSSMSSVTSDIVAAARSSASGQQ